MVLSQSDLQDKVSEVLEAVKKDQQATGSIQAVPKVVLVSHLAWLWRHSQGPMHVARSCHYPHIACAICETTTGTIA